MCTSNVSDHNSSSGSSSLEKQTCTLALKLTSIPTQFPLLVGIHSGLCITKVIMYFTLKDVLVEGVFEEPFVPPLTPRVVFVYMKSSFTKPLLTGTLHLPEALDSRAQLLRVPQVDTLFFDS